MALDDEQTTVDGGEPTEAEGGKKGGSKMIMLIGVAVGAIVIGVLLSMFVLNPSSDDGGGDGHAEVTEEKPDDGHGDSHSKPKKKKDSHGGGDDHGGGGDGGLIFAMRDIVVNPAGTGGSRFLSVSFGFELGYPGLHAEFEAREPIVRDALITILSSKTVTQLTDPKQKEIVRYQIKKRVSDLMETDEIKGVYYTDFVLQ